MLKFIKKILLLIVKIFIGFCALVGLFIIWLIFTNSDEDETSPTKADTDGTENVTSNNIRDYLASEPNALSNRGAGRDNIEEENQVLNATENLNTPNLSTASNRTSTNPLLRENNPNNMNRANTRENVNNQTENINSPGINNENAGSSFDLNTERTIKENEGILEQKNGFITFSNGLQIETPKMLKSFEFYKVFIKPEKNVFQSTNINSEESEKIKNYINEYCKNNYRNTQSIYNMSLIGMIKKDEEIENLIKKINLDQSTSEQLKNGKFYKIITKKLEGNITTKGTIKKLSESCQNEEIANIIKDIKEVEIVHRIDKEIIKTKYANKFVDVFNGSVIVDTDNMVHLDYSEVFLTKIQAINIIHLAKQQTEVDEVTKLFLKVFTVQLRKNFLVDFYRHIKNSGVVIPETLIDMVAKVIIKNPTQIDIQIEKFYDKESLKKALSDKNSECDTNYRLKDIKKFKNFEKNDQKREICKENVMKFTNMKKSFFELTAEKFGNFFVILCDEKIEII